MAHREVLEETVARTRTLLQTIDKTAEHLKGGKQKMFVGFTVAAGGDRFDEHISIGKEPIDCKLSGRDTDGALSVFEFNGIALGPRHLHHEQDEWVYVIGGPLDFEVGNRKFRAITGESVFLPRKVGHV